jgi:hypothetical protein
MKDLNSLLNGQTNTDVDLTLNWFATLLFNIFAAKLVIPQPLKLEMEQRPIPSLILLVDLLLLMAMATSFTECTSHISIIKIARPETETWVSSFLTEQLKVDLLQAVLLPSIPDKTITDKPLVMNAQRREIIILIGIHLHGGILPSCPSPRIIVTSMFLNLRTSLERDIATTTECKLPPTTKTIASMVDTNGNSPLQVEFPPQIASLFHGLVKTT